MPESRKDYWIPKIQKNIAKDIEIKKELKKLGWTVFTIWECQLKSDQADKTLMKLIKKIIQCSKF